MILRFKTWKPAAEATRVRFIPWKKGSPFFRYFQTWLPHRKRVVLCNCENGHLDLPCVICETAIRSENTQLLPGGRDAITVTVLETYHKVKKTSAKGSEYTAYDLCNGVDRFNKSQCTHCDSEAEKVFGNQFYWSLGGGHKKQLLSHMDQIAEKCGNCKDGDISVWGYGCPECDAVIASHKERELDEEEVTVLRTEEIACPHCEAEVRASLLIDCTRKSGAGRAAKIVKGCDNPIQVDPWSLDYVLSITGEGTSSAINVEDWSLPSPDEDIKSYHLQPMNFPFFLSHMPLEEQAKVMDVANPFLPADQKVLDDYFTEAQRVSEAEGASSADADSEAYD